MTEFVPQDRETGDAMRDHLCRARTISLKKIAIITQSALVKIQYRRLSEGFEIEFFEDAVSAQNLLREAD